ncbi:MAG: hypothetical protein HY721_19430, partial [Planctomycetes bacterium]|nr:hypothetical protein [Planctomycetota bacterium]
SDALAEASRLAALGFQDGPPKDVVALLLRAARGEAPSAEDLEDPILAPPPLRGGPWREADPPAGGHDPSPRDPRWTRVLRGGEDGARSVLLRLRVALDLEGKPQLLELASECWELERGPTALRASVWRFDRAERVHGRDPWRELPGSAEVALRDPSDPSRLLAAPVERLCASCHERSVSAAPAPAPAAGAASVAPPSTAERVARALEGVLGGR